MPVLRPGGMLPILPRNTALGCWLATKAGLSSFTTLLFLSLLIAARLVWSEMKALSSRVPSIVAALLIPSILGYAAAYGLFFRLYHPSRYMTTGPLLAVWLLGTSLFIVLLRRIPAVPARVPLAAKAACILALVVAVVSLANLVRVIPHDHSAGHTGIYRTPIPDDMLVAIRALPEDAMLAAHPEIAGDVPLLCKRSVYLQADDLFPYRMGYYHVMLKRLDEQQRMLFARDWETVAALAATIHVQYLLIDRRSFLPGYSAWSASYPELAASDAANEVPFILRTPPPNKIAAQSGDFVLVHMD